MGSNKNGDDNNRSDEGEHPNSSKSILDILLEKIEKFKKSIANRLTRYDDVEDCQQLYRIKVIKHFQNHPGYIPPNIDAFFWKVVNDAAIDINRQYINIDSFEDDSVPESSLSNGCTEQRVSENVDHKILCEELQLRLKMNFSKYEIELITLNYCKGCKPRRIAMMMEKKYGYKQKDVKKDLNLAMANFRNRIVKKLLLKGKKK